MSVHSHALAVSGFRTSLSLHPTLAPASLNVSFSVIRATASCLQSLKLLREGIRYAKQGLRGMSNSSSCKNRNLAVQVTILTIELDFV